MHSMPSLVSISLSLSLSISLSVYLSLSLHLSLSVYLSLSLFLSRLTDRLPTCLTPPPKCEDELLELLAQQVSTERKQEEAMEKLEARQGPRAPDVCLCECVCACICVCVTCTHIYAHTYTHLYSDPGSRAPAERKQRLVCLDAELPLL